MSTVPDPEGLDLIATLVQANVDGLAYTNRRINDLDRSRLVDMARTVVTLYEGIRATQRVLSTPRLDKALRRSVVGVDEAYRLLRETEEPGAT
jgi:hypothetical protein